MVLGDLTPKHWVSGFGMLLPWTKCAYRHAEAKITVFPFSAILSPPGTDTMVSNEPELHVFELLFSTTYSTIRRATINIPPDQSHQTWTQPSFIVLFHPI